MTATLPLSLPLPPAPALPLPGSYTATDDRCIVELDARLGPLTTLRTRFGSTRATLHVAEHLRDCALYIEADLPGLTTDRPLTRTALRSRRGLHAVRHPQLGFTSHRMAPDGEDGDGLDIHGSWLIRGVDHPGRLRLRITERADDRLVLLAQGELRYASVRRSCGLTLPWVSPADRLRLIVAADLA